MVDRQESGDFERAQSIRVAPPRLSSSFRRAAPAPPDTTLLKALAARVVPSTTTTNTAAAANFDNNLKQWELVEGDKGLRVVEKRSSAGDNPKSAGGRMINREEQVAMVRQEQQQQQHQHQPPPPPSSKFQYLDERLKALKAFERSKILPLPVLRRPEPDTLDTSESTNVVTVNEPISLDVILNQRKGGGGCQESTDTLMRLEQQVKAIEMGTIADRASRQRESSSNDCQPAEVQLRYREHEDLLRNVTDDEADG